VIQFHAFSNYSDQTNKVNNKKQASNELQGEEYFVKVDSFSAGQEIPWFYGNRRFIAVFTKPRQWLVL
jgi:hypothetical protein